MYVCDLNIKHFMLLKNACFLINLMGILSLTHQKIQKKLKSSSLDSQTLILRLLLKHRSKKKKTKTKNTDQGLGLHCFPFLVVLALYED